MAQLRIAQFLKLQAGSQTHRFQNYFINTSKTYLSEVYSFAPFQVSGTTAALNGDNDQLTLLVPVTSVGVKLLEEANGNRLSQLTLTNAWLSGSDEIVSTLVSYYTGTGSSVSDTTIELRFRSAADSVGATFPARTITRALVGPLPVNAELYLR